MGWRPICLVTALVWSALGAAPATAAEYHDSSAGFTITLPPGWSRLSESETAEVVKTLKEHTPGIRLKAAFRSGEGELPYMLVSELPLANASLERLATLLRSDRMSERAHRAAESLDAQVQQLGVPSVDERRQMVLMRVRTDQALSLSALFPGRTSVVQLMVAFAPNTADNQLAPFETITSSFRFDEGRGYAPKTKVAKEWWILLAVVLMAIGGISRARRREQRARGLEPPGPLEPPGSPERT